MRGGLHGHASRVPELCAHLPHPPLPPPLAGRRYSLTPFPNAIFFNFATIFVLGFGNLAALDFQARCMAAKTPRTATLGNLLAGALTIFVAVPVSYLGAITRVYYGPDSQYAVFEADTCHRALGLPQCGAWVPDTFAFLRLLTNEAPPVLGAWFLIAIVAASMSTADGAILALSTVISHNLARKLPFGISDDNLLLVSRFSAVPITIVAAIIAALNPGSTGYLLVVAFDIALAGAVVSLFAAFYVDKPSPLAALCSVVGGAITRVVLEFALPKDGFLILPFEGDEFLDYGVPTTAKFPPFVDVPKALRYDPSDDSQCPQGRLTDFTGVDSLASPLVALIIFTVIHLIEKKKGGPLLNKTWLQPVPAKDEPTKETAT